MNTLRNICLAIMSFLPSVVAYAHPHGSTETSNHLHFSAGSFALVALVLLGGWMLSRYIKSARPSRKRSRED